MPTTLHPRTRIPNPRIPSWRAVIGEQHSISYQADERVSRAPRCETCTTLHPCLCFNISWAVAAHDSRPGAARGTRFLHISFPMADLCGTDERPQKLVHFSTVRRASARSNPVLICCLARCIEASRFWHLDPPSGGYDFDTGERARLIAIPDAYMLGRVSCFCQKSNPHPHAPRPSYTHEAGLWAGFHPELIRKASSSLLQGSELDHRDIIWIFDNYGCMVRRPNMQSVNGERE
jgi:hypothetical protein